MVSFFSRTNVWNVWAQKKILNSSSKTIGNSSCIFVAFVAMRIANPHLFPESVLQAIFFKNLSSCNGVKRMFFFVFEVCAFNSSITAKWNSVFLTVVFSFLWSMVLSSIFVFDLEVDGFRGTLFLVDLCRRLTRVWLRCSDFFTFCSSCIIYCLRASFSSAFLYKAVAFCLLRDVFLKPVLPEACGVTDVACGFEIEDSPLVSGTGDSMLDALCLDCFDLWYLFFHSFFIFAVCAPGVSCPWLVFWHHLLCLSHTWSFLLASIQL